MNNYKQFAVDFDKIKPGHKILVRADLNLTLSGNMLDSCYRATRIAPLIKRLLKLGAHVTLTTHLGRPKVGFNELLSTRQIAPVLREVFGVDIFFNSAWPFSKKLDLKNVVVLTENVRFLQGEQENDASLAKEMAKDYDMFILEAFGTAHRNHASNFGIIDHCDSYLGPLFLEELRMVNTVMNFKQPKIAVIGGGKNSSKLRYMKKLVEDFQMILLGGEMANLFMASQGYNVGKASFSQELIQAADKIYKLSKRVNHAEILFPQDLWLKGPTGELSLEAVPISNFNCDIVDIGPITSKHYAKIINKAGGVLQNGPMGVIENVGCFEGTRSILDAVSNSPAECILGGGDTAKSIRCSGLDLSKFGAISTGGGALLHAVTNGSFDVLDKFKACSCTD